MCIYIYKHTHIWASQVVLMVKNPPANAGDIRDAGLIPGLGRSPGGGHGNSLQYSCLENPTDRGAWEPPVTESRTWLTGLGSAHSQFSALFFDLVITTSWRVISENSSFFFFFFCLCLYFLSLLLIFICLVLSRNMLYFKEKLEDNLKFWKISFCRGLILF